MALKQGVVRARAIGWAVVLGLIVGCGAGQRVQPTGPSADPEIAGWTEAAVVRHRQAIVLMEAAASLEGDALGRLNFVGKRLWHDNLAALLDLEAALLADLDHGAVRLGRFLDAIEQGPTLRDGDRLVFRDLLATLIDEAPAGALRARLGEDLRAIDDVRRRYRAELDAIESAFGRRRGMSLSREAWGRYVAHLRTLYTPDEILALFDDEIALLDGGTRGRKGRKRNPLVVRGFALGPKQLVLSFDDGPRGKHTAKVLDILKARGVKALFFQVGNRVGKVHDGEIKTRKRSAKLTKRIVAEGHLLGNHTYEHKNLPKLDLEGIVRQIDLSKAVLESAAGVPVSLFRPPYGAKDERVLAQLGLRKTKAYLWNIDSMDWADPIPESVAARILAQVEKRGRGVILMHDVHSQTVEALPTVLDALMARGYQFVLWDGSAAPIGGAAKVAGAKAGPAKAVPDKPADHSSPSLYSESWAVVVGINDYAHWPKLSYAVNDARAIRDSLIDRLGFRPERVRLLLDGEATRARIMEVLGDELPGQVGKNDRVFVFYAGHGATRTLRSGAQRGYIVPVDAGLKRLGSQAISMTALDDLNEQLAAKHVFFVMDACYSGIALTRGAGYQGDPGRYLQEITRRTARQILTAGGADEQVADHGPSGHSVFTWNVLQGLDGAADQNRDGYITASELGAYVAPRVSSVSRQTPVFGNMVGSGGGDFVLALGGDTAFLAAAPRAGEDETTRLRAELDAARAELAGKRVELARLTKALAAGSGDDAIVEVSKADRKRARTLIRQGLEYYRGGLFADALLSFKGAFEINPRDAQAINNIGFVYFRIERFDEAAQALRRAVELDPERAVAWLNLGDTYARLGRRPEAEEALSRHLELRPESAAAERIAEYLAEGGE